ncbi:MAG TPA: hypothetical protein VG796_08855 [Verrucomicrobiales bacterium]|nr:hypothetical protein [Verrucomicrobiales bacterium]
MAHHRHRERTKTKHALLLRCLCALVGLSFGLAAGLYFSNPLVEAVNAMQGGGAGPLAKNAPLPPMGAPLQERVAAVGRMDDDALIGLLSAMQDEWTRSGGTPEAEFRTMLNLRILFSRWTDLKGLKALKGALGLKDPRLMEMALEAAMTEWGLRDMLAASQSLTLIPGTLSRQRAMTALVRAGVRRSPVQGLAITGKMGPDAALLLRRTAGAEWMSRDATHALRFLTQEPGMNGTLPAGWALGQWLLEDPAGFMAWRKKDPAAANSMPRMRFPEDTISPGRLTRLHAELAKEFGTLDGGAAWLLKASGAPNLYPLQLKAPLAAAQAEMDAWGNTPAPDSKPEVSLNWLIYTSHARAVRMLALQLAESDPAAALKWLASLPAKEEPELLAPAVALKWLAQAPASAPGRIVSSDSANPVMKAAAGVAARSLVQADPLKSLESVATLSLDEKAAESLKAAAFSELASRSPATLLDWITAHPNSPVPAAATAAAVKALARTDLPRALQWVQQKAAPAEKAGLMASVFETMLRNDRDAALEYLKSLPAGKEREAAMLVQLNADIEIAQTDTFFAANLLPDCFEHALQLSADEERLKALRRVIQCMKQMRVPEEKMLSHPNLRAADRTALLKNS